MSMKATFWGVRAEIPTAPHPEEICESLTANIQSFIAAGEGHQGSIDSLVESTLPVALADFGSATHCVEIQSGDSQLIIDAGSGIKRLGDQKMVQGAIKKASKNQSTSVYHLLLSSMDFDRLLGLPFFTPIFIPKTVVHIYSADKKAEETIRFLFKKPFFPVEFHSLGAKIYFHTLKPGKTTLINGFKVTAFRNSKTDTLSNFKIQVGRQSYFHWNGPVPASIRSTLFRGPGTRSIYWRIPLKNNDSEKTKRETLTRAIQWAQAIKSHKFFIGQLPALMKNTEIDTLIKKIRKTQESTKAAALANRKTKSTAKANAPTKVKTRVKAPMDIVLAYEEQFVDI